MIIKFSEGATRDLAEISSYIEQDSPAAATRTITRILQSIRFLADFPRLGHTGLVPGTSELSILGLPFRAVYRVEDTSVTILAIIHTSRQYPK